jgi:transposase
MDMKDIPRPEMISAEDWAATPASVQTLILSLLKRLNDLEGRFKRPPATSGNSSQPPSKDQKGDFLPKKHPHKRGAKPGHFRAERPMVDNPDRVIEARPMECSVCQADLMGVKAERVIRRQVVELPEFRPVVIETRQGEVVCPNCQHPQRGTLPEGLGATRQFGPRLEGLVVYLKHQHHFGYDRIEKFFKDVLGVTLSEGGETCILRRAGDKAKPQAEKVRDQVRHSAVINSDETGARVNGQNHWEWVFISPSGVYHTIRRRRDADAISEFMGNCRAQVWGCDCFKSQLTAPTDLFQLCLGHQLRDLQRLLDQYPSLSWGVRMQRLFRQAIHLAKRRTILTARGFFSQVTRLERHLDRLLRWPLKSPEAKTLRERYREHRNHLFVFLHRPDVPYDNNVCERALRPSVIHRKVIGCFRSQWGAKAYAALATVIDTAKLSGQNVFETLVALMGKPVLPYLYPRSP